MLLCVWYMELSIIRLGFPVVLQFVLELLSTMWLQFQTYHWPYVHWEERLMLKVTVFLNIQSLNLVAAAVSTVKEVDKCPHYFVQFRYWQHWKFCFAYGISWKSGDDLYMFE